MLEFGATALRRGFLPVLLLILVVVVGPDWRIVVPVLRCWRCGIIGLYLDRATKNPESDCGRHFVSGGFLLERAHVSLAFRPGA